ncbi:MAG: flagellar hook-length control protein FliK [Moraxellaceae bacterium]|nr:flagellar hook-length control protein FliK [Moraxellaceae bacterium]MDZ4387044.1 flagellar hook-length control protein FliK [Moraxellaceae bacterium]
MRILPTPPPASTPVANNIHPAPTAAVSSLMASGAVLNATVLQHRGDQLYEMLAQRQHFLAHSQQPLQVGQKLTLQVNNKPQTAAAVELRIINAQQQAIKENLRAALPRQQDLQPLLQRLSLILAPNNAHQLPTDLVKVSEQFLRQMPNVQQISQAAGLQQAVQLSGIFHEAALLAGQPINDLKTQLLQLWSILNTQSQQLNPQQLSQGIWIRPELSQQLKAQSNQTAQSPLPGSLLPQRMSISSHQSSTIGQLLQLLMQDAEGVISRLESHQLMHLQQRDPQQTQWFIDLPVRHEQHTDLLRMHVQRDSHEGQEDETIWSFSVSFDFEQTGPMLAKITLAEGLSIQFYAERAATVGLINEFAEHLQTTLAELTHQHISIRIRQGMPHPDSLPKTLNDVLSETA